MDICESYFHGLGTFKIGISRQSDVHNYQMNGCLSNILVRNRRPSEFAHLRSSNWERGFLSEFFCVPPLIPAAISFSSVDEIGDTKKSSGH